MVESTLINTTKRADTTGSVVNKAPRKKAVLAPKLFQAHISKWYTPNELQKVIGRNWNS